MKPRGSVIPLIFLLTASVTLLLGAAGNDKQDTDGAPAPDQAPAPEDVMRDMESDDPQVPVTDPVAPPARERVPSIKVPIDPNVVGVAPGQKQPPLRREGEFVLNRRGRLQRGTTGVSMIFVFDAEGKEAPEPPMVMMPCQMLQSMEDLMKERGDNITFVVSGQVFVYRGANYLLPTMMKLAVPRGNLGK